MNAKKTLVLALVLVLSIAYLTKVSLPAKESESTKNNAFPGFDQEDVERIVVKRVPPDSEAESYELIRSSSARTQVSPTPTPEIKAFEDKEAKALEGWQISALPGAPLDAAILNALLTALGNLTFASTVSDEEMGSDFSVYGLDKPLLTVVVDGNGDPVEVAFGKKNEYLGQRYVKVSGRPGIHMVPESSFTLLNKDTSDLRDKTPVSINESDVRELVIESDSGRIKVQQVAAGEWALVEPIQKPASGLAVMELLRTAKDLRVSEFMDGAVPPEQQFGLDKPTVRLTLTYREGVEPKIYEIRLSKISQGGETPEDADGVVYFHHTGAPTAFTTLSDPTESLALTADSLRERKLLTFSSGDIGSVKVSGKAVTPIEIANLDTQGYTVNGKEADPVFAEGVIENIASLQADQFLPTANQTAFGTETATITVYRKDKQLEPVTIRFGSAVEREGKGYYYAKVGQDGEVVLVEEGSFKKVMPREETLLAPTPTPAPKETAAAS